MRIKILSAAIAAASLLCVQPARADFSDLLVGTWVTNAAAKDSPERITMVFRADGKGRVERRSANPPSLRENFTWKNVRDSVVLTHPKQGPARVLFRFTGTNRVILTSANDSFEPTGPRIEYERQTEPGPVPQASKQNVIGVWEAVISSGFQQVCRSELVLRVYGTGSDILQCGDQRQEVAITWEFKDGMVIKRNDAGAVGRGIVRFWDKTTMIITSIDPNGAQDGPETFYKKTAENDEGC